MRPATQPVRVSTREWVLSEPLYKEPLPAWEHSKEVIPTRTLVRGLIYCSTRQYSWVSFFVKKEPSTG